MRLEICCYSVECALTAQRAGADRIELCSGQSEGGITPSYGVLMHAAQQLTIPVHPMVRPRGGDFCYSRQEIEIMKTDIAVIKELGFTGLVLGVLNSNGDLNHKYLSELLSLCDGMAVTFHRAFDMCRDPIEALQQLADMGVARILTSGQQPTAEQGIPLLHQLIEASSGITILPGCGISINNIQRFIAIGATEIHSSAGHYISSAMRYRNPVVQMSSGSDRDEFSQYVVDAKKVTAMKQRLSSVK